MRASIILVTYNGMKYLPDCLKSLFSETQHDCEVILIDNASNDGSPAFIFENYPAVRLVRNRVNNGFAAACNQAAGLAQGEYLIFLNQDTRVCKGWLAGLLAPFASDAGIGLVTSRLLLMAQPDKIQMCGQDIHFSGLTFGRGFLEPAKGGSPAARVGAVSGASFAIPRRLWQRLGGFDDQLFMYYEETDLCWRAWLVGFASYYTPQSTAYHAGRLRPSPEALYYSVRNRWILLLKHWRFITLLLLSGSLFLAELAEWGEAVLYGRQGLRAKLRSVGWIASHLPLLLQARRSFSVTRVKPDWFLLEQCTSLLRPVVLTGGPAGKAILNLLNLIFQINYKAVLFLERQLNL